MILAIDPGKDKCGIAVLEGSGRLIEKMVVPRAQCPEKVTALATRYNIHDILIGDSAAGKILKSDLQEQAEIFNLIIIEEKNSTRQARERYWRDHPPAGFWKLIPTSLRVPPGPVDDYAALILGERYLQR